MPEAKRTSELALAPEDEPRSAGDAAVETPAAEVTGGAVVGGLTDSVVGLAGGAEPGSPDSEAVAPAPASPAVAQPATAVPPVPAATDARSAPAKKGGARRAKDPLKPEFLAQQRLLLMEERASYTKQAEELKAEADSLALEHEPGDVQFDEEGGEGGTSNVDRELDLVLSAQARAAVMEIDRALAKIEVGTYGLCEQCGQPIPHARLEALPYAALCVGCKSGGLSKR